MSTRKPVLEGKVEWAIGALAPVLLLGGCGHAGSPLPEPSRWVELFDGQSLAGWQQVNGDAPYEAIDGVIRGTNVLDSPNSFLASDGRYSDFVLEFESRSIGDANSGVQFRTETAPGTWSGVVGYQLDIDPTARRWTGGIYHEGVHVWRHSMARNDACQAAYQHGAWNSYRIEAVGAVIATWVNGVACAHMVGDHHTQGFIALQVHAIGQEEQYLGSLTEWRQLRLLTDPAPSDLWLARRHDRVEGWLEDRVSDVEIAHGWQSFDFSDQAATLEIGQSPFEIVFDLQMDDAAEGSLDYRYDHAGTPCIGSYKILNDATLGEARAASHLMGSFPDRIAAQNLSEPGRPKRIYADQRWNRVRINVTADRIEHWLNSVKVVDYAKCDPTGTGSPVSDEPSETAQAGLEISTGTGTITTRNARLRRASE